LAGAAAGAGDAAGAAGAGEAAAGAGKVEGAAGFDCRAAADSGALADDERVTVSSGSGCSAGRRVDEEVGFAGGCIVAHPDVGESFAEIGFICIFYPQFLSVSSVYRPELLLSSGLFLDFERIYAHADSRLMKSTDKACRIFLHT